MVCKLELVLNPERVAHFDFELLSDLHVLCRFQTVLHRLKCDPEIGIDLLISGEDLREFLQARSVGDESEHPLTALCVHREVGLRHDALDEPLLAHSIEKEQ